MSTLSHQANTELKKCKQCLEIKPLSNYRDYYNGRKGKYTICKECEKINSRYKYLKRKQDKGTQLSSDEHSEFNIITQLYEDLHQKGANTPLMAGKDKSKGVQDLVAQKMNGMRGVLDKPSYSDVMINVLGEAPDQQAVIKPEWMCKIDHKRLPMDTDETIQPNIPTLPELQMWLEADLSIHAPEYLQDHVYPDLKEKYRPLIKIDPITFQEVRDDTYKQVLDAILKRFDDYEDSQY